MKKTTMALLGLVLIMPSFMKAAEPSFEVYGFAQLDYIQDFNRVDPQWDSTLRPSKIPTTEGTVWKRRPSDLERAPKSFGRQGYTTRKRGIGVHEIRV
jgi:hypothetical protein